MLLNTVGRRLFSAFKVPIEALKKLRQETSAPMGECKKALEDAQGDHAQAVKWLREKGLMSASKRENKETREGVIAAFVSNCRKRAVLLEANCETDFVAKNDLFLKYVKALSLQVLEKDDLVSFQAKEGESSTEGLQDLLKKQQSLKIFPQDKEASNAYEELRVLISRLQENIRIRRVVSLHSDNGRFGVYVHQAYAEGVGRQACVVDTAVEAEAQEEIDAVGEFADNIATQVLGSPCKYIKAEEIPEEVIVEEAEKVREEMSSTLQKAPEAMHEKIIAGKLNSAFYEHCFLPSMPYILSNDGESVGQYWEAVERDLGKEIAIESSVTWECK